MKTLYLITCHQWIKIGICADIDKRVKALQTGNPYRLSVVKSYPRLLNARGVERAIHSRLIVYRRAGSEWFDNARDLIPLIDELVTEIGKFAPKRMPAKRLTVDIKKPATITGM